jgi:hypothetical protein
MHNEKFYLVYTEITIQGLYMSCSHRDEQFYKDNINYIQIKNKIKESILKEGLKYPLCVYSDGTGKCRIDVGNQRFEAIREIENIKRIPCLVHCRIDQGNNPEGERIPRDYNLIKDRFFNGGIKRFEIDINNIIITPEENDAWDPDKQYTKGKSDFSANVKSKLKIKI